MKGQTTDQALKGGITAVVLYILMKVGADSELILILTPVITGALAIASKKVGDPEIASFLGNGVAAEPAPAPAVETAPAKTKKK